MGRHDDFSFSAPLIGRDDLIQRIAHCFASGKRCVELVGPPGVGKTRLGKEACLQSRDTFGVSPDKALFCSLAGVEHAVQLGTRVAEAIALPHDLRNDPVPAIARWLATHGRNGLVLDNAELCLHPTAQLIEAILQHADETRILVTSRTRLPGRFAETLPVTPLSLEHAGTAISDACRLFMLFAGVDEDAVASRDHQRIHQIATRLDGLPLSLELAARRLNVLSLEQLEQHLTDRFATVRDGTAPEAPPPYHHALWQTLQWSWDLLRDWQRQALWQLSIFQGEFALDLAESVVLLPGEGPAAPTVVDALQALVRSSLVVRHGDWRSSGTFYLLETIRDFARRHQSDDHDKAALWQRYCSAVVSRVEALSSAVPTRDGESTIEELAVLRGDAFAVMLGVPGMPEADPELRGRCCLAISEYLNNQGERRQHLELIDMTLQALGASDTTLPLSRASLAGRLLWRKAGILDNMSRFDDAIASGKQALELGERSGDVWLQAAAHSSLFSAHLLQDAAEHAEVVTHHAQRVRSLQPVIESGERFMIPVCSGEGILAFRRGDTDAARESFEEGVEWAERAGHELLRAGLLTNLANVHQANGDLAAANAVLDEAIGIYDKRGTRRPLYVAQGTRAINDFNEGEPNLSVFQQVVDGFRRVGDERYAAYYTYQCGLVELLEGDAVASRNSMESVVSTLTPLRDPYNLPIAHCLLGVLDALDGDVDAGYRAVEDANRYAESVKSWPHYYACRDRLGLVLQRAAGELGPEEALAALNELVAEQDSENTGMTRLVRALLNRLSRKTDGWVFDEAGQWFQTPDGKQVDLGRRKAPKRILAALGGLYNGTRIWDDGPSHIDLTGRRGFTREELFMIGWPGQSIDESAAANRVYVALSTLRKLGLGDAILNEDGEYWVG